MVRISAFLLALCMMLIAAAFGVVVYTRFGFTGAESALGALGALAALAVYYAVAARKNDRLETSNQLAKLARGSGDLASELAEFGRRLNTIESKVDSAVDRAVSSSQPIAAEVDQLSKAFKQLAGSLARHEAALHDRSGNGHDSFHDLPAIVAAENLVNGPAVARLQFAASAAAARPANDKIASAARNGGEPIVESLRNAITAGDIELFLQPVVTLPQRKLRYYETVARPRIGNGEVMPADDFLCDPQAAPLIPRLDHLTAGRGVQIVRRLLLRGSEVGVFCNLAATTLADPGFPKLLELMDANRAIAAGLVFEFTQKAVREMGPVEHASLAALAERGFRFSMDNLADLRVNAGELTERGFRFVKVPASLLFNRLGAVGSDIRPAEFSDLLGRFGIDLIADRIEQEATVIDLLDYDVRFGQGNLFSPPRPLRAGVLDGAEGKIVEPEAVDDRAARAGDLVPFARAGVGPG